MQNQTTMTKVKDCKWVIPFAARQPQAALLRSASRNTNKVNIMMTLLEQAKANQHRKVAKGVEINDEVIELAFAWLKDEVKDIEVRRVLCQGSTSLQQSYPTLARALRQAYREGKLILKDELR